MTPKEYRTDIPPIIELLARPRHGEEGERVREQRPVHGLPQTSEARRGERGKSESEWVYSPPAGAVKSHRIRSRGCDDSAEAGLAHDVSLLNFS